MIICYINDTLYNDNVLYNNCIRNYIYNKNLEQWIHRLECRLIYTYFRYVP